MKYRPAFILIFALLFVSCSNSSAPAQSTQLRKISQFDKAGLCDFLIDKSGVYHAVFQERPDIGKPIFIYYSTSTNKGASWSKPIALSNDYTGNGAGYPRILQDASGKIYAIWKRFGYTPSHYTVDMAIDGPGGNTIGTIFYKVLDGGAWSQQVQLNEIEGMQDSWFATVAPNGSVYVFWSQLSLALSTVTGNFSWYNCDLLRVTALIGTGHSAYVNLSTPAPISSTGYPTKKDGAINLSGFVDANSKPHLIYQDNDDYGVAKIEYYDGKNPERTVYTYPAYKEGNTFINPAHLLLDEKGNDHLVFLPCPATLESEQVWDINLATNKTEVLTSIQQSGIKINGFQASQGPNCTMSVTIEAGTISGNNEAFGMFYSNGGWKDVGLTNNASKSKFFSKDFVGVGGSLSNVSLLTTYSSTFASVAYDASGHKSLIMNIAGTTIGNSGYSISNPFIIFMPVDHL